MAGRHVGRRAVLAGALAVAAAACAVPGRAEELERWQRIIVEQGVASEAEARCVMAAFFDAMTDAEFRDFQRRERLTEAERAALAVYTAECEQALRPAN